MKRLALLLAAICGAATLVAAGSSAAAGSALASVSCTDAFSGSAVDVVVPDGNFCNLTGATVTHDVIIGVEAGAGSDSGLSVGHDVTLGHDSEVDFGGAVIGHDLIAATAGSLHFERTTIGHDLIAVQPGTVQTGQIGPDTPGGPVKVGRDLVMTGTPPGHEFVFDGLDQLSVERDLVISGRSVTLGIGVRGDTIGRDLVMTNDAALVGFFGPSELEVRGNSVGRDLIFTDNSAVLPGGQLIVSGNVVGRDAICAANDPPPSDGNTVGRLNSCG
jgi:hypothetical protein